MSQVAAHPTPVAGQSIVLDDVDWSMYSRLLRVFAERPRIKLTYDQGRLEIMSPVLEHDWDSRFFCLLVGALADELDMPFSAAGSATMRRPLKQKGIEADECFWIANSQRMIGRRRLDLSRDPPPDLTIEVDVTSSSMDRLGIYAALRVPEVSRVEGEELVFYHLDAKKKKLRRTKQSRSFPGLRPRDLLPFLEQVRDTHDQFTVLRSFRAWVQEDFKKGRRSPPKSDA